MFELDSRLQQDTIYLGDFALSRLLLMNDSHYPWFILVPRLADVSELFQLSAVQQQQLWSETTLLAQLLKPCFAGDKINIATLGNVVSQLHMHVVVRRHDDVSWPAPVWGRHPAVAYTAEQVQALKARLQPVLPNDFSFAES
jgi:diadenosine tetraphosphate (Ap4A) HIT family hydrolase